MSFSNTYDTTSPGSAALNREDLQDAMSMLAPSETPVLSSADKFKCNGTFVEWGVDKLSTPSSTAVSEGADVTDFEDKFESVARLGNYVQKLRRSYRVSDLQQAVSSVGPQDIARAEMKAVKELKRDVEKTILGTQDRAAENGGGTAYTMRGLGDWIDSSGPSDVPADYRTPSGSIHASGAFTETVMNKLITSIYRVSGVTNSLTLVADTALRRVISDFARSDSSTGPIRTFNSNSASGLIKLSVGQYQSDHGIVTIVDMNPDCAPDTTDKDTGYLVNPEYYAVGELIPLGSTRLPNLGGGERGYVDWTGTLKVAHPGAHGKITDVTA
jgi:hypothetical protein